MNDSLSFEDKLKLEFWGLPKYIQVMYEKKGIKTMFPWQVECLSMDGVLDGKNLIYSAPTSAGKTLVAEILCLQTVLERKRKAIFILPFVSVVREKMFYFQDLLSEAGVRVEGFMGSYHPPGGFKSVHIAICTIEKANNLINKLMEEEELSDIGCVVVDELHMLGDPHRGYLLELLLTKIKFITKRKGGLGIQIVGMSATLPNLDVVAKWLNASLYKTDFRPVPLKEYLKVNKALYSVTNGYMHDMEPSFSVKNDPGDVIYLCIDTILKGFSVLVFCPTKNWCESLAQQISSEIKHLGRDTNSEIAQALRSQLNSDGISDILERLKRCPVGLDSNLARSVSFGVSFHHAGLTLDERDIVEGSFKEGLLRVLVATTTLSSGVNLPARRVIIRSPIFNSRPLDVLTYKQMTGRAGRMGRDTEGESYLICNDKDRECGIKLVSSDLPPVSSCLASSDLSSSLTRAILEVVASGVANSKDEIEEYASCTLVHTCDPDSLAVPLSTCLSYLETNEFTRPLHDGNIAPSPLAQATLSASLYPHQAVKLLQELYKASSSFIINNNLHAIYQVTPYSVSDQWSVDWVQMFNVWEQLSPEMKNVGYLVGVEESFLVRAMRSNVNIEKFTSKLSIHRRFYTSLALQDLINEVPFGIITKKFNCNKGMLQSLQQSASTFAGMVTRFCERLGWSALEAILEQLSSRIEYGAQRDLLDLLRLDCYAAQVARVLYSSGIKSVAELASSSCRLVQTALTKLVPFQSEDMMGGSRVGKSIWINGKSGMTEAEAAQYFINRARKFLLEELGVSKVDWKNNETKEIDSIYLNSTVNPCDLSKDLNAIKSNSKLLGNFEIVNDGTPVSSSSLRKKIQPVSYSEVKAIDSNVSFNNQRLSHIASGVRTSSPIYCDGNNEEMPNINVESPIIPEKNNGNLINGTNLCNELLEPDNEPDNHSFKTTDVEINSRLSMGDLFESFEGVVFNGTSELVNEVKNCNCDELKKDEICNRNLEIDVENEIDLSNEQIDQNSMKSDDEIERVKTRNSLDIFFDSFTFNNSSFSQAVVEACKDTGNVLEEMDCNWGGESLLETSLIINNISKQFSPATLKRKLSVSGEQLCEKRRKKSFGDTFVLPSSSHFNTKNSNEEDELHKNKNVKAFKKSSKQFKKSSLVITSTQKLVTSNFTQVANINLATCSEISAIEKYTQQSASSDESIIESPTRTEINENTKLQITNVKNISGFKTETNSSKACHQLSLGLTESYLDAAFGETFNDLKLPDKHSNLDCLNSKSNSSKSFKKSFSFSEQTNKHITGTRSLKRLRSEESILNSPDVFMSPSRRIQEPETNNTGAIDIKTPTKLKSIVESPLKGSPVSRRCKKESPSKYSKLNVKIVKTPEKSLLNDTVPDKGNITPSKQNGVTPISVTGCLEGNNLNNGHSSISPVQSNVKCKSQLKSDVKLKLKTEFDALCQNQDDGIEGIVPLNRIPSKSNDIKLSTSKTDEIKSSNNLKSAKPQIIFACQSCESFKEFENFLFNCTDLAVSLDVSKLSESKDKIGSRIRKQRCSEIGVVKKFVTEGLSLDGLAFYSGGDVYYVNLLCQMGLCLDIVMHIFRRSDITLILSDVRRKLKLLYNCCNVTVECHLLDPLTADWLIEPHENTKSLQQLVKEQVDKIEIPSLNYDSCTEEVIQVWCLMNSLEKKLNKIGLRNHFVNVEMPLAQILVHSELTGIGFDITAGEDLMRAINSTMKDIEEQAQKLCNRIFNLGSRNDVSKIKKLLGITADNENDHRVMMLIRDWRKLHSLKTRNLSSLMLESKERLHPVSDTKTATGRITLYDPDIQHIPRDFIVGDTLFNPRICFVPHNGNVFVGADYCQLELRILAHFSKDEVLLGSFSGSGDVFKEIAAKWNNVAINEVNDDMRHKAKQICYGLIYGMGRACLGEQLSVSAADAATLQADFKRQYPGVKGFIEKTVYDCQKNGFINTLAGRSRSLPHINSTNPAFSKQGERQAVNSIIQGSASDIAKRALVKIETTLGELIPERSKVINDSCACHLVLHLHDEFIYEVSSKYLNLFIKVIKRSMEQAAELSVPLTVKVKSGDAWGSMDSIT